MNEADIALNNIVNKRYPNNKDKAKKALKQFADEVAYQETRGRGNIPQDGGGPGRGYYQYELEENGSGANKTAVNRAINWHQDNGKEVPEWINDLKGKDVDFTTLSKAQQTALFFYDKNADSGTKLNDLVDAHGTDQWEEVAAENWEKGHHKGDDSPKWVGSDPASKGTIFGDPHIKTFDGLSYDFQSVGEFILIESQDDDFEVQIATEKIPSKYKGSYITRVGTIIDGYVINLEAGKDQIIINDNYIEVGDTLTLGDGSISLNNGNYKINYSNGEGLSVKRRETNEGANFFNLSFNLFPERNVVGLLGNNNGDSKDDLSLRDGTILDPSTPARELLGDYAESWKVEPKDSLFQLSDYSRIDGTPSDDILVGSPENDLINGFGGDDTIAGGLGNDQIFGGDGDDVLRGDLNKRTSKNDIGGDDIIFGGEGNDRIGGKGGNDQLFGEAGDDQIWGDDGDDILRGGGGNDTLTGDDFSGGSGSDTFVLAMNEGTDTIVDFQDGEDLIGLADSLSFGQLSITQDEKNALISFEQATLAIIQEVNAEELTEIDFISIV